MKRRSIAIRVRRLRAGGGRALLPVALAAAGWFAATAGAQELREPPAVAPRSQLTVTPAQFEIWLAGLPARTDTAASEEPPARLTTAPPPPPVVTTPAPPPIIVTPLPAPTLAPAPAPAPADAPKAPEAPVEGPTGIETPAAPEAPVMTPGLAAGTGEPLSPQLTPPPPPIIAAPPPEPRIAALPPESREAPVATAAPQANRTPGTVRILFPEKLIELPEDAKAVLNEVAARLAAQPAVRVQIVGFASEIAGEKGQARRRSLFRVLAVRKYLVGRGVASERMDVRALGDNTQETPLDRVEIMLPPS